MWYDMTRHDTTRHVDVCLCCVCTYLYMCSCASLFSVFLSAFLLALFLLTASFNFNLAIFPLPSFPLSLFISQYNVQLLQFFAIYLAFFFFCIVITFKVRTYVTTRSDLSDLFMCLFVYLYLLYLRIYYLTIYWFLFIYLSIYLSIEYLIRYAIKFSRKLILSTKHFLF